MKYLSPDWIDEANKALTGIKPGVAATLGVKISAPDTAVTNYSLVISQDSARYILGEQASDLSLTSSWETAIAIAQGITNPKQAFLEGSLKIGGKTLLLTELAKPLAEIEDCLVELRSNTEY